MQNTFNVKNNQTFTQIAGNKQGAKLAKSKRAKKRELLDKQNARKKKQKESTNGDHTMAAYKAIVDEMGDRFYMGYSTSSSDEEEDKEENVKTKEDSKEEAKKEDEEDEVKIALTPQELYDIDLEDAIIIRRYVIEANSMYRIYWDFLIILAAILNSIILPFDIAFPDDISQFPIIGILDNLMQYIFITDVILGFNTSYINV